MKFINDNRISVLLLLSISLQSSLQSKGTGKYKVKCIPYTCSNFIFYVKRYVFFRRMYLFSSGPNIIFILIDDVGWADFGYNNNILSPNGVRSDGLIPTPNIDKLAKDGLKLTSHYVHPTCTPSR